MQKASLSKMSLKVIVTGLLLIVAGFPPPGAHAQRAQDGRVTVQSISSRSLSNGTVVSIVADGSLSRAPNLGEGEGDQCVVPYPVAGNNIQTGPGVKDRELG